jgi:ectoine hydroxylase-related dioxygenase (phytanoyl-CoA dioxygenase family)
MEYSSLSVWMPLQEATLENGCMQFIPGSHRLEVLPHQSINNDPRIHGLEVQAGVMDTSQAVACPLPPGGATFHLSRTFHYTAPNTSDVPRRALIMGGSLPAQKRAAPRRFPWLEEKQTARLQRAARSQAASS